MPIVQLILGILGVGVFLALCFYVTYLFAYRLKRRESPVKSFMVWLRDLFDLASGLG